MQGNFRVGRKVARMTLRIEVENGDVTVSDLMLQPGRNSSGWLPHVTELPWAAGIVGGRIAGGAVDSEAVERLEQLEKLTLAQGALLQKLGVDVDALRQSGGIDQQAIYDAFVKARGGA